MICELIIAELYFKMMFLCMQIRDLYKKAHETGNNECLLRLVDQNLHGVFNREEVTRVMKIAVLCANDNPASRPTIMQVLSMLLGTQPIPEYVLKYLLSQGHLQSSPPLYDIEMWDASHDCSGMLPASLESRPILSNSSGTSTQPVDRSLSPVKLSLSEGR
jgi:hypothetical protein